MGAATACSDRTGEAAGVLARLEHPDVLAERHPLTTTGDGVEGVGHDPAERPGQHGVRRPVRDPEEPQGERSRAQPEAGDRWRRRQRQHLLADIAARVGPQPVAPRLALRLAQTGAEGAAVGAGADRPDHQPVEVADQVVEPEGGASPPGVGRRQQQALVEQGLAQRGEQRRQGRRLDQPGAEAVGTDHRAPSAGLEETGHAQLGVGPQLERVAPDVVDASQHHVDRAATVDLAGPDPALAHLQVGAGDQGEAEQGGEVGLVEGRLAVPSGGQHHDPRALDAGRGQLGQRVAHHPEVRREPVQLGGLVGVGEQPRHHATVLHRVAQPRRRLRAIADHPPRAVGGTAHVGGGHDQPRAPRGQAPGGADIAVEAPEQLGRDQAGGQQSARAVEVGEHRLQQPRALARAALEAGPLVVSQDRGQRVEPPLGLPAATCQRVARRGGRQRVVGDAVVLEQAVCAAARGAEALGVPGVQRERLPPRARVAVGTDQLVVAAADRVAVGAEERRRHASRPTPAGPAGVGRGCGGTPRTGCDAPRPRRPPRPPPRS